MLVKIFLHFELMFQPEQLFRSERSSFCLVGWGGAASERVADREDSEAAERVQREQDEDGEGHQGVHHLEEER